MDSSLSGVHTYTHLRDRSIAGFQDSKSGRDPGIAIPKQQTSISADEVGDMCLSSVIKRINQLLKLVASELSGCEAVQQTVIACVNIAACLYHGVIAIGNDTA